MEDNEIRFTLNSEGVKPILTLSERGFEYRGELIEDAGEAYRLFLEVMNKMNVEGNNIRTEDMLIDPQG